MAKEKTVYLNALNRLKEEISNNKYHLYSKLPTE